MLNRRQKFGKKSEKLAVGALKKMGYKILKTNYRTKFGEIDIIAKEKNTIVFVEVKARKSKRYGNPKLAVTQKKQRTISMVALAYLQSEDLMTSKARFDVVAITDMSERPVIEIIRNAFELAYG